MEGGAPVCAHAWRDLLDDAVRLHLLPDLAAFFGFFFIGNDWTALGLAWWVVPSVNAVPDIVDGRVRLEGGGVQELRVSLDHFDVFWIMLIQRLFGSRGSRIC